MYNQNKLLLRFVWEPIRLILKRGLENIFILTQREKCTGVPTYTMHQNLHTLFNEIDGDFDDMTISTFKVGLPTEHGLRKFLTGKPVTSVCQLMDRIDKYKRVEEDQQ